MSAINRRRWPISKHGQSTGWLMHSGFFHPTEISKHPSMHRQSLLAAELPNTSNKKEAKCMFEVSASWFSWSTEMKVENGWKDGNPSKKLAYSVLWEMGDRKACYMQFAVNGLKHVKLLACSFKQHEHTHRLKRLRLFVYAVCDAGWLGNEKKPQHGYKHSCAGDKRGHLCSPSVFYWESFHSLYYQWIGKASATHWNPAILNNSNKAAGAVECVGEGQGRKPRIF